MFLSYVCSFCFLFKPLHKYQWDGHYYFWYF
nr:MAG TPA: hypothetical protein [Caudoviricetes sp.]